MGRRQFRLLLEPAPQEVVCLTQLHRYAGDVAGAIVGAVRSDWDGALLSDITERVSSVDAVLTAIRAVVPDAKVSKADDERVSPASGFDTAPLGEVIGCWQETSLEEGVRQTVALYRSIAARQSG